MAAQHHRHGGTCSHAGPLSSHEATSTLLGGPARWGTAPQHRLCGKMDACPPRAPRARNREQLRAGSGKEHKYHSPQPHRATRPRLPPRSPRGSWLLARLRTPPFAARGSPRRGQRTVQPPEGGCLTGSLQPPERARGSGEGRDTGPVLRLNRTKGRVTKRRRFPSPWEPQRNGRARGRRDRDRAQGLSWLGRRGPSAHRGPLPTAGLGAGTCPGTGHPAVRPGPAQPGLRARLRGSVRGSGEPRAPRRPSPLRRAGPAAPTGRDGTGQPAGPSVHGAAQPLPGPRVPPRRPARPSRESPQRQRRHLEAPRTPEAAVTHFRPHRPGLPVPPGATRYPRAARHPWGSAR